MNVLHVTDCSVEIGAHTLVQPLSFTLGASEMLGLIGPNGAGKSTLIKAIAQLLPYQGAMEWRGTAIETLTASQRARQLAYLSQDDSVHLPITVRDLVRLGRHPYRGSWWRGAGQLSAADDAAIAEAMRVTDVWTLRERRFTELSGGERARVRLARMLAVNAPLLLADEPVAALDPRHQLEVMTLLREQCQRGASVIVVLHDLTLASRFCERLLLLNRGKLVASGAPDAVLNAENLRRIYGIEAVTGEHAQQRYLVPWMCAANSIAVEN